MYFPFIKEYLAIQIFSRYYDDLHKTGNYIFLKNLDFDKSYNIYYDIAIIKASNMYEIIKFMNTCGVNYDITNDAIIEQMKKWDNEVKFKLIVADEDRIEAYIQNIPTDLKKFTEEIYKFCPDVIEQGYGSMEEMIKDYKAKKYFWMWWD